MQGYCGRTLCELLAHAKKYGKMDDTVHDRIMTEFREPPNMDLPIDKYYAKQEECRLQVADSDNPITDSAMVQQLTQHLGKVAGVGKAVVKFKKKNTDKRKWDAAKVFFRDAIEDLEDISAALGIEPGLHANATINEASKKESWPTVSGRLW